MSVRAWSIVTLTGVGILAAPLVWNPPLGHLNLVLTRLGALAFGGGFAMIPLIEREVVAHHAWVTTHEFIDGIALGQVTPGPIMITATYLGYRLGGLVGAVTATAAMFLPSFLILIAVLPRFERIKHHRAVRSMVHGVLAGFIALLVFVLFEFARASLDGWKTVAIALAAAIALWRKVDLLLVVAGAAVVSVLIL
jgi:chromate transporter